MMSDRTSELPSRFRSTGLLKDEVGGTQRRRERSAAGLVPVPAPVNVRTRRGAKCPLLQSARRLLRWSSMRPELVIVHSAVGGGHKAAAAAIAEAASDRGLSTVVLDTFEHAPRVFGQAYLAAHLAWQGALPELYGKAYFGANHRDGAFEPVRRGFDHIAWAGLVRAVMSFAPRAVIATHHLPLVVLGRARRPGWLGEPPVGVVTAYGTHAVWAERGVDALCVPGDGARRDAIAHRFEGARVHTTGIP